MSPDPKHHPNHDPQRDPKREASGVAPPSSDATPPDEHLLAAFARGEARAFERLYARHDKALYRFVRRLLGTQSAALVDEVFQDTWLRAIQATQEQRGWRPGDASGASFRTWLFTIAHHRALDLLRKSGREQALPQADEGETPFEPELNPWVDWPMQGPAGDASDRLFWRSAGQRLLDCLDALPLPQKTVFLLHHDDGVPVVELARALGVGFETAKTRLRYAMSKLRTCMGAYLPASEALPLGSRGEQA